VPTPKTPKRYAVTLDPTAAGKGMKLVSLVKSPAIGAGWVALASAAEQPAKRLHLSTATTGPKQVLTGPLLIPDLQIRRIDPQTGEEFYISFSAEQIEVIAHRFMAEAKGLALSNQNHADDLEGNQIREFWIVRDAERDAAAVLGIDVPAGTLMCSMHVANADFWKNEVETGNVTGFSIEGLFDFSELQLQAASAAPKKPMNFLAKLRAAVALAFANTVALAALELEDGTALEVDDASGEVYQIGEDGSRGEAQPDGTYKLKDGTEVVIKDGKHVGHQPAVPAETAPEALAEAAPAEGSPAADVDKRLGALEKSIEEILVLVKKEDKQPTDETKLGAVTIDEETYNKATTALAAAELEVTRLSAIVPAGQRVKMGAAKADGGQDVNLEEMSAGQRRLYLARQKAKKD
jgi:hypothetical protein